MIAGTRRRRETDRVGPQGPSTTVKIRCTDTAPASLNDVDDAQEMGAQWGGVVTYDFDGFMEQFSYYESNDYMIDND